MTLKRARLTLVFMVSLIFLVFLVPYIDGWAAAILLITAFAGTLFFGWPVWMSILGLKSK